MRRALEAVLPMVRERLLSEKIIEAAGAESSAQHHFRPYDNITKTLFEAAFDAAFPEDRLDAAEGEGRR